jgi:hypothetical protein
VIGPGWLPRPISRLRKRTLAYTRVRRRHTRSRSKPEAKTAPRSHHEIVIFDHGPIEFPIATIVPHDPASRVRVLVADIRRWLAARWAWLRPRTVPVVVAALGATFVIASAEYLSHGHGTRAQPAPSAVSSTLSTP